MTQTNNSRGLKAMIYGGNFIFPSLVNILKNHTKISITPNLANPYGALFYGALDMAGGRFEVVKNSWFTRLSKVAGLTFYGIATASDLVSIAGGEYKNFVQLPFDASMAYQLSRDTFGSYGSGKNYFLWEDIASVVKVAKGMPSKIEGLRKKISKLA
ncbi:MAG: hypothetical protein AABY15_01130 [Nanoarchaeota archaeon]